MPNIAPLADPAPQEPPDLLLGRPPTDQTATGADPSRGCPDEWLQRPGHARPVATWSVGARTLTMQRQLIAGLIG